jgi:RNA polymerase sigma-70 factor (ECF subfamily)
MKARNESSVRGVATPQLGSTSLSLLVGLRGGCPEAWRRLAYLYGPILHQWCVRRKVPQADTEDIVQEVLLAVTTGIHRFRRERKTDTFRGWLRKITDHKLADWVSRRVRERGAVSLDLTPVASEVVEDMDDHVENESVTSLYARALNLVRSEFEEKTWQAFWSVTVEDRDPADVAADLHLSRSSVYVAKSRVLRRLREVLGDA